MFHGWSLSLPGFDNKVVVIAIVNKLLAALMSRQADGAHYQAKSSTHETFKGLTASLEDALTLSTESDALKSAIAISSDPTWVFAVSAATATAAPQDQPGHGCTRGRHRLEGAVQVTPTSASWLNQLEIWFSIFRHKTRQRTELMMPMQAAPTRSQAVLMRIEPGNACPQTRTA